MNASGFDLFIRMAERALPTIEAVMKQAKIIPGSVGCEEVWGGSEQQQKLDVKLDTVDINMALLHG